MSGVTGGIGYTKSQPTANLPSLNIGPTSTANVQSDLASIDDADQ